MEPYLAGNGFRQARSEFLGQIKHVFVFTDSFGTDHEDFYGIEKKIKRLMKF